MRREPVESVSLREVGQRLARLLLEEAGAGGRTTARGVGFKQQSTHNRLAARAGTVREAVTRVLYRLQTQRLIVVEGKDVVIPNPELLSEYADAEAKRLLVQSA